MKNSHYRDWKMEAYCDKVRRLEDKFYELELNHIASADVFCGDIHQPSVKIDDTPEPEEASAQPEVPSAAEGEALRVEGERNGVTPNPNW
jgi:hypothetical protein